MAKSDFEKALEKQTKEQKKQHEQKIRVETASSVVNGQPFIGGMRIMDDAAEEIFQIILNQYDGNDDRSVSGSFELIPRSYHGSIMNEFEKLKQYGVITEYFVFIGGMWEAYLTPQGILYFERKETALSQASKMRKEADTRQRKEYDN